MPTKLSRSHLVRIRNNYTGDKVAEEVLGLFGTVGVRVEKDEEIPAKICRGDDYNKCLFSVKEKLSPLSKSNLQ